MYCVRGMQLRGTWQVLVRSTFRQTSTLPSTVRFVPEHGGTVRLVRVRNSQYVLQRSVSYCLVIEISLSHLELICMREYRAVSG